MTSLIINIAGSPIILLAGLIAAGLTVKCFIELFRKRHARFDGGLTKTINSIPVVAGIMPLFGFLHMFIQTIRALFITRSMSTGDPRVVSGGIAHEIAIIMYPLGLFLFFYFMWLVLRVINDSRRRVSDMTNTQS
ncbi:MAG: hypothetical protein HOC71_12725 [Candidatus Latescibacteria bacterium]|jgi:hypothetical protein|nr:hypothetical protein [Candidatus Latescibacterota bacterium]